jgi:hypothetical protein
MTTWPAQTAAAMNAFYGNPDADHNGVVDPKWEAENIVGVVPPYRMVLAWAPAQAVKTIRIHKRCAESLSRVLAGIEAHYGSQEAIERARMHLYGGGFNFRLKRGGSTLSNHSWGSAIDLDPEHNGFGRRWSEGMGMMPRDVVDLFRAEGWTWGGLWNTADAMHFQACSL